MAEDQAVIRVRVLPKSSRNQIVGYEEDVLKVKLTSPPIEGKANKALIEYIATKLGIAKVRVEITSGSRSRLKTVRIRGLSPKQVSSLISDNLA